MSWEVLQWLFDEENPDDKLPDFVKRHVEAMVRKEWDELEADAQALIACGFEPNELTIVRPRGPYCTAPYIATKK